MSTEWGGRKGRGKGRKSSRSAGGLTGAEGPQALAGQARQAAWLPFSELGSRGSDVRKRVSQVIGREVSWFPASAF